MLPELPPDIQEAQDMGVILYSGSADRRVSGRKALRLARIRIVESCPRYPNLPAFTSRWTQILAA